MNGEKYRCQAEAQENNILEDFQSKAIINPEQTRKYVLRIIYIIIQYHFDETEFHKTPIKTSKNKSTYNE